MQSWTIQNSIDDMDKAGTQISLVSITTPGLYFGHVEEAPQAVAALQRLRQKLVADHPGRFGMFTALPMPISMARSKRSNTGSTC